MTETGKQMLQSHQEVKRQRQLAIDGARQEARERVLTKIADKLAETMDAGKVDETIKRLLALSGPQVVILESERDGQAYRDVFFLGEFPDSFQLDVSAREQQAYKPYVFLG